MFYPPDYYSSVWEFNVSTTMTGQPDHVFLGTGGNFACIGHVMWHVDLNGDGRQDLVDGEQGWGFGGKVFVFLNGPGADTLWDATYYQGNFNAALGQAGCNVGDFNGDGIEDMAVNEAYYGRGRLHLILGNDSLHQSNVERVTRPSMPISSDLLKAYPNPFNGSVILEINALLTKPHQILIYNVQGKKVRILKLEAGETRIIWDGKSSFGAECSAGIYWAKLIGPTHQATIKLTLIR